MWTFQHIASKLNKSLCLTFSFFCWFTLICTVTLLYGAVMILSVEDTIFKNLQLLLSEYLNEQ